MTRERHIIEMCLASDKKKLLNLLRRSVIIYIVNMSRWVVKKPRYGDHIRVNRGIYYHHGIYLHRWCVIHYSAYGADANGNETASKCARIIKTSLKVFAKGDRLEVRTYDEREQELKFSRWATARAAKRALGSGLGQYNLRTNNCEHFANECIFGVKSSEQSEHPIRHLIQIPRQRREREEHEREKQYKLINSRRYRREQAKAARLSAKETSANGSKADKGEGRKAVAEVGARNARAESLKVSQKGDAAVRVRIRPCDSPDSKRRRK